MLNDPTTAPALRRLHATQVPPTATTTATATSARTPPLLRPTLRRRLVLVIAVEHHPQVFPRVRIGWHLVSVLRERPRPRVIRRDRQHQVALVPVRQNPQQAGATQDVLA